MENSNIDHHPSLVNRMALDAMFSALYLALASVSIPLGNIHLSFASLPLVVASILFGGFDGLAVAFVGEGILQVFNYGLTLTTPLWLVPPLLRAVVISFVAWFFRRRGETLETHRLAYFLTLAGAALLTSLANTLALYLDALIIGYPYSFLFLEAGLRLLTGTGTSLVVGIVGLPLLKTLRHLEPQG
jgi:uncharacterized membrane protein